MWVRGKIGEGRKRGGVEIYSQERFIACTGRSLHVEPLPIAERQALLSNMVLQMPMTGASTLL
ncbi:MAG TPA: hypothetical protein VGH84_08725, partial [Steroidobacteraceae bacterium]